MEQSSNYISKSTFTVNLVIPLIEAFRAGAFKSVSEIAARSDFAGVAVREIATC
jgi:hypothetical protein